MEIVQYSDKMTKQWDDFVLQHPDGWHYHLIGWREVIKRTYGHVGNYISAIDNYGKIHGLLPLVMIKSRIFGNSLTSLPFVDYAGLISNNNETSEAIIKSSMDFAQSNGLEFVELRQLKQSEGDFVNSTLKVTLVIELPDNEEALFKSLSSERRNRVKKARNSGLSVELVGPEMLPIFFKIWSENMRDLGSPAHSYDFFKNILEIFSDSSNIMLVKYNDEYIGGAISLFYKEKLALPWVSSLRKTFHLYPNNILYWEAMLYAISRGFRFFDFGRSTIGSGTYTFKKRWGAEERQLFWQKINLGVKDLTESDQEKLKYKLLIALWKKIPISCSRVIGPKIRRFITA